MIGRKEFPPLGILYLSSWLKQHGYEVHVVHGQIHEIPPGYDVYGISSTTPQYPTSQRALKFIKYIAPEAITVIGGAHVNAPKCQQECIVDGWDYVVVGEGQLPLLDIVEGKKLLPQIIHAEVIKDVGQMPMPDRDAIDMSEYGYPLSDGLKVACIHTAFGCPYKCQFCSSANGVARWNPIDRVVEEVDLLVNKYDYKGLLFTDDVFTLKYTTRMKDLLLELKPYNLKWRCYARTDIPLDWLEFMAEHGCVEFGAGVESGNQKILDLIMKRTTTEGNAQFIKDCRKAGILANTFLMIGLPGESPQTIEDTKNWVRDAMPQRWGYNLFVPYPDTPIIQNYEYFKDHITVYDMPYEKAICKSKKITECYVSTPELSRQRLIDEYYKNFEWLVQETGFDPRKRGQRAFEFASASQ